MEDYVVIRDSQSVVHKTTIIPIFYLLHKATESLAVTHNITAGGSVVLLILYTQWRCALMALSLYVCVCVCVRVHPHNCLSSPPSRTWIICVFVSFISRNNSKDLFDRHRFKPAGKNRNNGSFIPPQKSSLSWSLIWHWVFSRCSWW